MQKNNILILLVIFLAGCSTYSNLSSFSSRKYTKGYFFDAPGQKPAVVEQGGNTQNYDKAEVKVERKTGIRQAIITVKAEQVICKTKQPFKLITVRNSVLNKPRNAIVPISTIEVLNGENSFQPGDDKPDENYDLGTKNGLIGFFYVIAGILLIIVGVLLIDLIAFGGASGGLLIVSAFLGLAALLFLIVGLFLCIKTLITNDRYKGFAIAGIILGGYILVVIISLLSHIKF